MSARESTATATKAHQHYHTDFCGDANAYIVSQSALIWEVNALP